jgi:hypothetical protein
MKTCPPPRKLNASNFSHRSASPIQTGTGREDGAKTLAGLKFKLRAVSWCTQGRLSAADLDDDPQPARDMRLLAGLLADLSAMGSAAA